MLDDIGMGRTIRDLLREGTAGAHAQLDDGMGALITGRRADYAKFLTMQYSARRGIEAWLEKHEGDAAPPPQTVLIAEDLRTLDHVPPSDTPDFSPPENSLPLGVCWVLAGSSLGNRMILSRLTKIDETWPVHFLSDAAMHAYWRNLLPQLQATTDAASAGSMLAGAQATFAHFNAIAAARGTLEVA